MYNGSDELEGFPEAVAEVFPEEFEKYLKLRERVVTIEAGARSIEAAIDGAQVEGRQQSEEPLEGNVVERVRSFFHPQVYSQYLRWKPILRALEHAAHDLEGASLKLRETDEYFIAAVRALEEKSIELPDEDPMGKPDDGNFPDVARERHPDSFKKYLYHKERVRDVEIAAKMVELATRNVEDKKTRFLISVANLDRSQKPSLDQNQDYGSKLLLSPSAEPVHRAPSPPSPQMSNASPIRAVSSLDQNNFPARSNSLSTNPIREGKSEHGLSIGGSWFKRTPKS
ncbi:hypothetical protein M427DRAFT_70031 [Gonapodya prolifera JEL478]|uniref:Uncharacterized protein n=1 Tax=Gonapodya prolifera (strain JEL478) TaxID=1344416 RepID=A0A139AFF2_GONPJ|nr:hypothetical protein M427DRAFT_70031 [Gonapodya prolifera JEL478]|eukprot:KXS15419.1 hypothetical protein M427DRAFT_70031 [Gonapodya prolifera JEL478]